MIGIRLDSGDLACAEHRGPPDPRRGRLSQGGDRRLQRPRRADHRDAQGAGRQDQRLGRRHAAGHRQRRSGPGRRLQALGHSPAGRGPGNTRSSSPSRRSKVSTPGVLAGPPLLHRGQCRWPTPSSTRMRPARAACTIVDPLDMTRRKTVPDGSAGEDLLVPVFRGGRRVYDLPPIWRRFAAGPRSNSPRFPGGDQAIRQSARVFRRPGTRPARAQDAAHLAGARVRALKFGVRSFITALALPRSGFPMECGHSLPLCILQRRRVRALNFGMVPRSGSTLFCSDSGWTNLPMSIAAARLDSLLCNGARRSI